MLKVYADKYIQLGGKLADAQAAFDRVTFGVTVDGEDIGPDPEELRKKDTEALEAALGLSSRVRTSPSSLDSDAPRARRG